jgi:hypothetical protein
MNISGTQALLVDSAKKKCAGTLGSAKFVKLSHSKFSIILSFRRSSGFWNPTVIKHAKDEVVIKEV